MKAQANVLNGEEFTAREASTRGLARRDILIAFVPFFTLALFSFLSINQLRAPEAIPATAPPGQFSSGRAMKHLEVIARAPHSLGSHEQAAVRDYILTQLAERGLRPEVQTTVAVNQDYSDHFPAATVRNIVARLEGTNNSKAILLVAHYDSMPLSNGANDNGTAVATLLETLGALVQSPTLKNDVIFLFTDGEEQGLLGAKAFVAEHPWAKDVGPVLNFESRGNSGPVVMFETSGHNGWLIDQFAKAAPHPIANSCSYEIYRMLGLDTDFTEFKKAGFSGLNFAYIYGPAYSHTQLDNTSNVDERSLQHEGSYALALTRQFGGMDLADQQAPNMIYFDLFGSVLIHYSEQWAAPLAALVTLLFVAVAVLGLKRKQISIRGLILGFLFSIPSMILVPVIVTVLWQIIRFSTTEHNPLTRSNVYNGYYYIISFVALSVSITATLYIWFRKKVSGYNLALGGLLGWVFLLALTAFYLPGASYLFTWPLLFNLLALGIIFASKDNPAPELRNSIIQSAFAVPAIIIVVPFTCLLFAGLPLDSVAMAMILVVVLLTSIIPLLGFLAAPNKWALPAIALLVSIGFILLGMSMNKADASRPKVNNIFYALDADSGKATWASFDRSPDEWTSQFFPPDVTSGDILDYFPMMIQGGFLRAEAPAATLLAPNVTLLNDSAENGVRTLRVRATSPRQATTLFLYVFSDSAILAPAINDKRIVRQVGKVWVVQYYALPAEGIELAFQLQSPGAVRIRAVDIKPGLPELPGTVVKQRPDHMIPAASIYSDASLVNKTYLF